MTQKSVLLVLVVPVLKAPAMRKIGLKMNVCFVMGYFVKVCSILASQVKENSNVQVYINALAYLGCWPGINDRGYGMLYWRYWVPRFIMLNTAFCTLVLSPVAIYMFWGQKASKVLEPAIGIFLTGMISFSILFFIYEDDRFKMAIIDMNAMIAYGNLHIERPKEITDELQFFSSAIFYYFIGSAVNLFISCLELAVYSWKHKIYFLGYWYPYDMQAPIQYELTIFILFIPCGLGVYLLIVVHCLFMMLMVQAFSNLKMLAHNLQSVKWSKVNEYKVGETSAPRSILVVSCKLQTVQDWDKHNNARLRTCIQHHQAIFRFIESVHKAFGGVLVLQMCATAFPMILGILLLKISEFDTKTFCFLALVIVVLVDLAVFCSLGEAVKEQNDAIREAAFGCDWLHAPDGFKRSLRIIISRCNKPLVLNLAGYIPLTLETFVRVLNMGYNFYMSLITFL